MFFLDLTRVALKIPKVTLRFTTIRISFAAVLSQSPMCAATFPAWGCGKEGSRLPWSFPDKTFFVTAFFRWNVGPKSFGGYNSSLQVVKNFGRALMLFKSEISGETLTLSPVTTLLRPDSAHARMKEIGAFNVNQLVWVIFVERYGFWFQWDIPSLAWRKLLKLLAEDGEKMPKARRHGSFIYVNVCHRFFLGKKARIGETASCNYKCARLHGQKSLQGAILALWSVAESREA